MAEMKEPTTGELEMAINALCVSCQFGTLHRVLKGIPGSFSILVSDRTAEQKRQELLKLLKSETPESGKLPGDSKEKQCVGYKII